MSSEKRSSGIGFVFPIVVALVLGMVAFGYFQMLSFRRNLAAGRALVAQGQHAQATPLLDAAQRNIISGFLNHGHEIEYLTGLCLWRSGDTSGARAKLRSIPGSSPLFTEVRLALADVELDSGHWRAAEDTVFDVLSVIDSNDAGKFDMKLGPDLVPEIAESRVRLDRYFRMQGRYQDAARQKLLQSLNSSEPIRTLKSAWRDEHDPLPVEKILEAIGIAGKLAIDDSRVLLARAIVTTAEARYDEADEILKRCEDRVNRPDEAVLEARLEWMRATGRPYALSEISWITRPNHRPLTDADKLEWSDMILERTGDDPLRKNVLETWRKIQPRSPRMLSRFAIFLERTGNTVDVQEMQRLKEEAELAIGRYAQLMQGESEPEGAKMLMEWARSAHLAGHDMHAVLLARLAGVSEPANAEAQGLVVEYQKNIASANSYAVFVEEAWKQSLAKAGETPKHEASGSDRHSKVREFVDDSTSFRLEYEVEVPSFRQVRFGGRSARIDFRIDDGWNRDSRVWQKPANGYHVDDGLVGEPNLPQNESIVFLKNTSSTKIRTNSAWNGFD